jgi:hypothetical protein
VIDQSKSQETLKVDGPFAVAFDEQKKMYLVYNYDEDKFYEWKIKD